MKAVKKIEISVLHKRITPIVYAVQADTGREIECTVDDWDIPAGVEARAWVIKPSKKVVYNNCRIVGKAVFVALTNQMLAEPGGAICIIEFADGDDVVSSFSFNLYVYEKANGSGIPSENESTVLEGMFEELAQDAIKTLNEAKAQAAAAKKSAQDTEKIKNDFTLTAQQATADVNNAGQTQTQRVNTAGYTQVSRIQAEGTTQVQNVQATAAEISADREQIHTNRDNVARLQRTTAGAIMRSAEGSFITLEDAADEMGFRQLEIAGKTEQRTTTGAQLLNLSDVENAISNGLTYSIKNGVVTASGTPAVEYASIVAKKIKLPPGNYYASGIDITSGRLFLQMAITSANGNKTFYSNKGFTIDGTEQSIDFVIQIGSNITALSKCTLYPMLNAGDTPLPWEPYTGSKPSPSPEYPQEMENVGVQREDGKYEVKVAATRAQCLNWNIAAYENCIEVNQYTVKCNLNEKYHCAITVDYLNDYILSHKGEQMTLSFTGNPDKKYTEIVIYGTFGDGRKVSSAYALGNKVTITIPEDTITVSKLDLRFNVSYGAVSTDTTTVISHIMLNAGSTALPWEPYRGHTATITSDRPLTKWDKLTCRDGVWGWAYGGTTVVEDGSQVMVNTWYPSIVLSNLQKRAKAGTKIYCNYCNAHINRANDNGTGICINDADTYWNFADANAAKTWLTQKNAEGKPFYYQYETQEEEWVPLSAEEQAAMNALCTYAGTTHIWTDDPLQPVISLDYTVDTEGYIKDTTPAYRDVERFALTGEASGTVATCTDSADWPLLGVGMLGKCEQVTTTGAQLLDWNNLTKESCVPIEEGVVRSNITGGYYCALVTTQFNDYILTHKDNSLTLSCKNNPSGSQVSVAVYGTFQGEDKTVIESNKGSNNATIVIPGNILTVNRCEFRFNRKGTVFTDTTTVISDIMLNAGSTALPWEPYTGAAPSPSPDYKQEIQETGTYNPETGMYEADMVMTGSNLFNPQALLDVGFVLQPDGSYYMDQAYKPYHKIMWKNKYNIDVSVVKIKTKQVPYNNLVGILFSVYYTDGTTGYMETPADTSWHDLNLNPAKKIDKILFSYGTGNAGTYIKDVIISATTESYSPYTAKTLRLTADQPWRGIGDVHDEVCDRDGVLGTLRRFGAMEYNTAALHSANLLKKTKELRINPPQGALLDSKKKTICDKFRNLKDGTWNKDVAYVYGDAGVNGEYIAFRVDINENPETFFVDNPIKFVYQLAEPYFEPFPEEIQKQYRKLKSCAGTTHAWVDDPLQPEVSFKYVKDSKLILGKLEDRLTALEAGQAQTAAAFSYLPPEIQAEMIETETRELMNSI